MKIVLETRYTNTDKREGRGKRKVLGERVIARRKERVTNGIPEKEVHKS